MPKGATQYVKTSGGYVAYQEFGTDSPDILFITNWSSNLEVMWEEPSLERYLDRLGTFGRVICFDKRGTGVSDPVPLADLPTLEEWMDEAGAGDVLVSRTVKDLVVGSGNEFESRGQHALKGVPGEWELFRLVAEP